jgi:hypothetical protein
MDKYVSIEDLIQRDIKNKSEGKYQIQSCKNSDQAKIVKFDKKIMDICIYETTIEDFKCSLIQYSLSDNDIDNKNFFIIGYLIRNLNDVLIGSLNLKFLPCGEIKFNENINGKFQIILSNNKNEHKIIRSCDKYIGNDDVIYFMTEILCECLILIVNDNEI